MLKIKVTNIQEFKYLSYDESILEYESKLNKCAAKNRKLNKVPTGLVKFNWNSRLKRN
jgi:hypothetical protein